MRPALLYQRHSRFFVAGPDIARHAGVPLVLEWNCSEAWTRANWEEPPAPFRALDPMLCSMERHVVRRAAKVLAVSRPAADIAPEAGADPAAVVVVPNATHVAEIRALTDGTHPRGQRRVLVGWIGSFGVWHGATVLMKSMAQSTGVDLLMIGDGWERDACQVLADSLGIAKRIEWAGSLPHAEAVRRLAECDVLASPHVPLDGQAFFGSPTKLFEYMAIGRPIIASDLEQLGEVLEDGRTALLVRPGDPAALAARIAEIAELPDRGAALGAAARQEATQHHDWVHRADAVLTSLLGPEAMAG